MDEVMRLDVNHALVIVRGMKVLEVEKYDYSNHPESKKLVACKASAHVPAWRRERDATVGLPSCAGEDALFSATGPGIQAAFIMFVPDIPPAMPMSALSLIHI